jgi:cytochrome c-type protein NapB
MPLRFQSRWLLRVAAAAALLLGTAVAAVLAIPPAPIALTDAAPAGASSGERSGQKMGSDKSRAGSSAWQAPDWSEESLERLASFRANLRAYEGAPPVIPHEVSERGRDQCLTCHGKGIKFSNRERPAPIPPHSLELVNCQQCHVQRGAEAPPAPWRQNVFEGLEMAGRGHRSYEGAPPLMPHRLEMRENCLACHGDAGWLPIRSSHPWRSSCNQCHPPLAGNEQFPLAP